LNFAQAGIDYSYGQLYMRVKGVQLKSGHKTAKPDHPQNDGTAASVIAQQYFPATVVSLHFQFT
jgi:hypothetical protein